MLTNDFYWFWLCNISGVGRGKVKALVDRFNSAKCVYGATKQELLEVGGLGQKDIENILESRNDKSILTAAEQMENQGIQFVHMWQEEYPQKLRNIYDAPVALYYKGQLPSENVPAVAMVGARNCTNYGKHMAYELARGFADMGWQVISGMALGIDGAAHRGACDSGGYTCGVLGCGVDICYPRSNIDIYSKMAQNGCIISEYALNTPPHPGQFPVRNRIISGLADAVIVVEARAKSGSLITVEHALDQGKCVYAVPGRVGDALSEGCNWLLKLGAGVITSAEDIKEFNTQHFLNKDIIFERELKACGDCAEVELKEPVTKKTVINSLATEKNMVYSVLGLHPKSLELIIEETGLDMAVVSEQLLCLQLEGMAREIAKNCYSRV